MSWWRVTDAENLVAWETIRASQGADLLEALQGLGVGCP